MKKLGMFMAAGLSLAVGASSASAAAVYVDTSFTAGEGFSDGMSLWETAPQANVVMAQVGWVVANTAGIGTLDGPAAGWQRALFGQPTAVGFSQAVVDGLFAAGETLEITASGIVFSLQNSGNVGTFGLADVNDANLLGSSGLAAGAQFSHAGGGGNVLIEGADTGKASGVAFDYRQVWIPTSATMFDIQHYVDGSLLTTSTGVTPTNSSVSGNAAGFINAGQGPPTTNGGTYNLDGYKLEVVPEPASLALMGLGGLLILRRRS